VTCYSHRRIRANRDGNIVPKRSKIDAIAWAIGGSVAVHLVGIAVVLLATSGPRVELELTAHPDWVDVEIAPAAPEVFEPSPAIPEPSAEPEPEPAAPVEQTPDDVVEDESETAAAIPDAGPLPVDGGALARAEKDIADAGVLGDAGPLGDAGDLQVLGVHRSLDAGVVAEVGADAGAASLDGGLATAAVIDAGPSGAPAGTAADFRPYLPGADVVSVLLRLDRLRKTPWAKDAEAIMAPMPDHRMIIGNRNLAAVELFDSLFIASPDPTDVTATTLIGNFTMSEAELRTLLDHPGAPVHWQAAVGGSKGIVTGARRARGDDRIYFVPYSGWVVLTKPRYLGDLAADAPELPLTPRAKTANAPEWVKKIPALAEQAGLDSGPFAVVTAQGLRGRVVLPALGADVDQLPVPERAILTLELDPQGFLVRGTLHFQSERDAESFLRQATQMREDLVGGFFGRKLLSRFHALNAARGLQLKRNGAAVAYVTSMSIADAQAMLRAVASWSQRYFGAR